MLVCPTCGKFRNVLYQVRDGGAYVCRFCAQQQMMGGGSNLVIARYEQEGVYQGLGVLHMRLNHIPREDDWVKHENEQILQNYGSLL